MNAKPRVWVFVEQEEGQAHPVSWELLGKAGELARDLEGVLEAVVLGHGWRRWPAKPSPTGPSGSIL